MSAQYFKQEFFWSSPNANAINHNAIVLYTLRSPHQETLIFQITKWKIKTASHQKHYHEAAQAAYEEFFVSTKEQVDETF